MRNPKRNLSRRDYLRLLLLAGSGTALAACGSPKQATRQAAQPTAAVLNTPEAPAAPTAAVQKSTHTPTEKPGATQSQAQPEQPTQTETKVLPGPSATPGQAYLSVARGEDTAAITEAAIKALGGMERFVKNEYDVIIKPNICTDYYPYEYGATTNPILVATLVKLALGAGAKRVRVMDTPFGGTAQSAYAKSGIADAVKAAGGEMEIMTQFKYKMTKIPQGKAIKQWAIYQEVLTCDLFIDVGTAKHHSLARVTAAEKNLLGVVQRRSEFHADLGQRLPDLLSVVKPGLTIIDAVRTLMRNGPTGGNLDDVKINNTVVATHDTVAADTFAAGLFGLTGKDLEYISKAAEMGLGTMDLSSVKVEEISL